MAFIASLLSVSPNCTGATIAALSSVQEGSPDLLGKIYLVQGEVETLIFESELPINTNIETWEFIISQLTDTNLNVLYDAGNAELDALIESITNLNGLYKFEMIADDMSVETHSCYVLVTCAIDCCMANLLGTVINCNCEGGDCHDVIRKIEKILILIRCAVVDAANGDIAAAQEKYNKAAELCDSTCDCNC
jgi:hypothetical protein